MYISSEVNGVIVINNAAEHWRRGDAIQVFDKVYRVSSAMDGCLVLKPLTKLQRMAYKLGKRSFKSPF